MAFIVLIVIGIQLGSIDADSYDDLGLLTGLPEIAESENGFKVVSYTQKDDFSLFESDEDKAKLKAHINFEIWDEAYVNAVLARNKQHIDNAIEVRNYSRFKFTNYSWDTIPHYSGILDINRLLILNSMWHAKRGSVKQAIEMAESAVIFSQRVKMESNHALISYMLGLAIVIPPKNKPS